MDNQALTPSFEDLGLDASEVVENIAVDASHQEEVAMASLASTKGWQKISARMQQDIDGLRTGQAVAVEGASLELIGQRFVIASAVAGHLQSYLDMVNNAQEATKEYEARRSQI